MFENSIQTYDAPDFSDLTRGVAKVFTQLKNVPVFQDITTNITVL